MGFVLDALIFALLLFVLLLIGRVVISLAMSFAHEWRPKGAVLVVTEICYSVTDPPLKALQRVLPTIDVGSLRIDLAWPALFLATSLLRLLLGAIRASL